MKKITLKKVKIEELVIIQQALFTELISRESFENKEFRMLEKEIGTDIYYKFRKTIETHHNTKTTINLKISQAIILKSILMKNLNQASDFSKYSINKFKDDLDHQITNYN